MLQEVFWHQLEYMDLDGLWSQEVDTYHTTETMTSMEVSEAFNFKTVGG